MGDEASSRQDTGRETAVRHRALGLSDSEVVDAYGAMSLARALDERVWALNRQGVVPIVASCQGHEAAQIGYGLAARKHGPCFFFTYYRDVAFKLFQGMTAHEAMLSYMGKAGETWSGARQFPTQGARLDLGIINISNVVPAGITQAVGYALACKRLGEATVVLASFGDGATSSGEWHEALNFAGIHKLPVVFLCQNNGYAISVPLRKQMAVQDIASRAAGYGFPGVTCDGTDLLESFSATAEAIVRARSEGKPTLVEFKLDRLRPHTTDDDDRRYRPAQELETLRQRDPLLKLKDYLSAAGLLTREQAEAFGQEARAQVDAATDAAETAPLPDPSTFYRHLYAPLGGTWQSNRS
ncbi:MAG: thiamine pyrophosphate-dependent dehydrogenase E1 component subunit alpha [Chloroflexota bacterium]|nr:thiamine pyrophosphate-dependent dehydrogenase E1 component subunit alpha [Chloroflexota bacterium]